MQMMKLPASALLLTLICLNQTHASDVGVDIPATSYTTESAPLDPFTIQDMGTKVGFIRTEVGSSEYLLYEGIDFGEGATHFTVRASSATEGGQLIVRLATPYNFLTTVATVEITNTGGWDDFQDFTVEVDESVVEQLRGRNLYLVIEDNGMGGYQYDIESFRFDNFESLPVNAATYSAESYPSSDEIIRDMGNKVGYIQRGSWVRYSQFDLGNNPMTFSVTAASASAGGTLIVTTNAPYPFPAGEVIAVVEIGPTESWEHFQEFSAEVLSPVSGVVSNLYLNFQGGAGYLYDIESFELK